MMLVGLDRLREAGPGSNNQRVGAAAGEVTAAYQLARMARLREAHTALMLELDVVEHRNRLRVARNEGRGVCST